MSELVEVKVPAEQEGTTAVVRNWLKAIGDTVSVDDPLVEIETDKVTQEIPSPVAGVLTEMLMKSGEDAQPGAVLGRIRQGERSSATNGHATAAKLPAGTAALDNEMPIRYSPAVRRAAEEYGIDPATVKGSGKGGRVTRMDMDEAKASGPRAPLSPPVAETPPPLAPEFRQPEPVMPAIEPAIGSRSVPHSPMRLAIARNMVNSVATAPHVSAVFEADFTAIIRHRERNKALLAAEGINLSYTAYIIAACIAAMRKVPEINSRWHDDRLEVFNDVNVGIGTALGDKGLIVPVIHKAQQLSLEGIAARLQDLTTRARSGALDPADVRGGTFTISNHGVSGSLLATPIINQPQSAILGVGKVEKRVVVREIDGTDTMQIRPLAYVSLTIDHRALDGYQTNAWLSEFVGTLENWPS
ncbi:2-oxo acid dehydrogenase subunit E2 [Rhizobium sp. KVB221]|uniref:Dihydrolipoamide acetyltransferase component of pyruvate dehydrogenase complex n=1 Tax=Rhizobium setariae TaxID=2801340 RepID=A0A936YPI8_9HYPH|nr:2-oxo acid dehydrogenase subunit E2 [Rhizobium setariae]MBL0373293.1 2-oxo acid dehydrogenase subunit E2 [Rhizobium setariae]